MKRLQVRGRDLRYILTLALLDHQRPLTVDELVALLERDRIAVTGRPSKVVSDALRWEIGHRRVRRVGRACYEVAHIPRSTRSWMRQRVELVLRELSLQRWQIEQ
jgi:hypothetical protein